MALKVLMLKKRLDEKRKSLDELNAKIEGFALREEELAKAIEETTTEEEQKVVEDAIEEFEKEKADVNDAKANLEKEVSDLEDELQKEETEQEVDGAPVEAPKEEERKVETKMETRKFFNLNTQERDMMFAREDVKAFLGEIRTAIREKRAVSNVGLLVPEVFLGLIRENIEDYSKLYKHVYLRQVNGEGRVVIMAQIPEAVWTDCCGNLNDLELGFYDAEFNCWKVGGYYAICNANIEDSDVDLASEILTALGQATGKAIDKAITFGTGTRMPLGIVTRLLQTEAPSDYPATARPWVNLSSTNVITIPATATGVELFKQIALASGNAKGKYARGGKVFAMNEGTYTKVVANAMSIDANGSIVAGVNGTMPVIGGVIEVLDFIPDNVIIGGYYDLYTLVERAGNKFMSSEHVRFLQDQTVYKGTGRYDGKPVIAEGFVAIGIDGTTPTANVTFAPDVANTTDGEGA